MPRVTGSGYSMIDFGREVCDNLDVSITKEWLVTNGIGGYASGTVAGLLTRRVAASRRRGARPSFSVPGT